MDKIKKILIVSSESKLDEVLKELGFVSDENLKKALSNQKVYFSDSVLKN